jgi:bifunctional non-homologous end joining protein LigD
MIRVPDRDKPKGSLAKYRQKRDPGRTNEPFEAEPLASSKGAQNTGTWEGAFVVHEHDASRHHYDLRLEVAGVLKSFAVPQGPSLDPKDKRLAVETEDHPMMYLDYEGVIPDGNYGAGPMIAWDTGRVRYLEHDAETGIEKRKIDFELYGYKLRGRFALVLTSGRKGEVVKQRQWLLFKKTDIHARAGSHIVEEAPQSVLSGLLVGELERAGERARSIEAKARALGAKPNKLDARSVVPMAATNAEVELQSPQHLYELKLDGVRIVAHKQGDEVVLYYRKGRAATASYPDVVRAIRALPVERLVLDGEIVAFDNQGRPDFQRLAHRFQATRAREVQRAMLAVPVSYVVFDALAVGDADLTSLPLVTRKEILRELVPERGMVRSLDHIEDDGRAMFEFCRTHRLEGVIAKLKRSSYRFGPRATGDWVKVKADREDDFVVVGYTKGKTGRAIGALDLATYDDGQLVSRGKVGSGLDGDTIDLLLAQLEKMRVQKTTVQGTMLPAPQGRTFVRPELVVNVRYSGFTDDGHLRHPVYRGLRVDVSPRDCTVKPHEGVESLLEEARKEGPVEVPEQRPAPVATPKAQPARRAKLTNPDKVFWPVEGYTKRDLWNYYEAVAPALLPFLRERPVILVRYPDGVEGKSFYQWNAPKDTPSWVRTVKVRWEDRENKEAELFLIDDVDTLLYIANLGCIPLHILASRMGTLSTCDFLTVDFDLNGQALAHGITLARELEKVLAQIKLKGYPKTSGQTGIHVLVPLGPNVSFTTACALCDLLGSIVQARHRDIATLERRKEKRGPRVYVDTGQTGTIRAIVSPYSVRAYAGGRVSTPLLWDEVGFALDPSRYTMFSVPERVAEIGNPMQDFLEQTPNIEAVVAALAQMLPERNKR